ncbi:MAG: hypothetical protein A3F13_02590 [Gammaproteobacteria bacterium RIFCSPHIGHO2_12_FULL_40_19]|nr:MAG: hypothetical protein A3F13_02590 [Gammaproteobacteria bacterium RIFCSPHIGHO2_12_FULL_40_19]
MAVINNSINNKVGATNSGATNTFTVDNASDTASSKALMNITVGGGTAADAFETFTVSGTTNWSQGVDNSASDAYVLSASTALGTTNIMSASTAGEINYPLQPAFLVQLASTASNVIGNSATPYQVLFDTEVFDQNSDYASSTFTAPVTGRYQLSTGISMQQLTALMTFGGVTFVATSRTLTGLEFSAGPARTVAGTADLLTLVCSVLMDMTAGDTCSVKVILNGGASAAVDIIGGTGGSFYSGFLAC